MKDNPLAAEMSEYADDPYGYVLDNWAWSEGELLHDPGPDEWQVQFLKDLGEEVRRRAFNGNDSVEAVRMAVASGHGIGKGVIIALVACWIMDTRPNSQGTVTANTYAQLSSKTWTTICRWRSLSRTAAMWTITADTIYNTESKSEAGVPQWFLRMQSSDETNSEAFAGQHKKDSTSYYLFDEASAIGALIWEKADGGLTDGEPMFFAMGNPTRNTGEFYEVCFGAKQHLWNVRSIDSRTSRFTNPIEIQKLIETYGIDSDRVRYQVLGLPPQKDEAQFIGKDLVEAAQQRQVYTLDDDPLVAGFDVSGGGSAMNVIRFRRGLDARPGPRVPHPIRIAGSQADRPALIARCAQVLKDQHPDRKVAMMFVDSAFGSPIVERLHTLGYDNVQEVNFGGRSPDPHQENMRAHMWNMMAEWLKRGAIDPQDKKLKVDLISPGFHHNKSNKLVLESKQEMQKRGVPSPDDADALCLTWSQPVAAVDHSHSEEPRYREKYGSVGWMR